MSKEEKTPFDKTPEEQTTAAMEEGMKAVKEAIDDLEDQLLPPLNVIVPLVTKAVPGALAIVRQVSQFLLNMPMSGLLHTVLIDMFPLYIFYFSAYSVLIQMLKSMTLNFVEEKYKDPEQADARPDQFAPEHKSSPCISSSVTAILWNNQNAAPDPEACFNNDQVDNPPPLQEGGYGIMATMNIGAFVVCLAVWLVVIGNFFYWNKHKAVNAQDGDYFINSIFTRRNRVYRYVCGLLGLGIVASIGVITVGLSGGGQWNVLTEIFPAMLAACVTGKPILAPKKPKFDYNKLSGVSLKRASFFTTNASFASSFGDALMQANRGFPAKLKKSLAKPGDWKQVLEMCIMTPGGAATPAIAWGGGELKEAANSMMMNTSRYSGDDELQ